MANYTYHEAIDNRYIRHLKPQFNLATNPAKEALLIRLLLGTVKVSNILSTDRFDQFNNYSILGVRNNTIISTRIIKDCIEPESNIEKLCTYLDTTKYINNEFFENLLEEISSYFYKRTKSSATTCFVHLYRALEYISYSFPLLYASISRDYYGSFNKIKNYFDTSKSELLFFDEFTKKLLDEELLEAELTLNFNTLSDSINRNHFNIIKMILTTDRIEDEVAGVSITTSYEHLIKLVIDLRNRYFHFAIGGQRNIRSSEIVESDIFFSIINEEILNWITIIYFEILKNTSNK